MAVPGWQTSSDRVFETLGFCVFYVPSIALVGTGVEWLAQTVNSYNPGDQVRLTFQVRSFVSFPLCSTSAYICGNSQAEVLASTPITGVGNYTLYAKVPAHGVVTVVVKGFNGESSTSRYIEIALDAFALQRVSGVGSIIPPSEPDPDLCPYDPLWTGFLTTGDISCLTALLRDCSDITSPVPTIIKGPARVEPSRIQNLNEAYVRSLVIVNQDRERTKAPEGCREPCYPYDESDFHIVCDCVAGEVRFESGYSMNVRQDNTTNSIIFDAEPGSGLGYPCVEPPIHQAELPPQGFSTLSGSLKCNEVIRSFNGIGGRNFIFSTGTGVEIIAQPDLHRVIIDVNMHSLALAPEPAPPEAVECFKPSSDPCDCGPLVFDEVDDCPQPPDATSTPPPGGSTTQPPPPLTTTQAPSTLPPMPLPFCVNKDSSFDGYGHYPTPGPINQWYVSAAFGGMSGTIKGTFPLNSPTVQSVCPQPYGNPVALSRMGVNKVFFMATTVNTDLRLEQILNPKPGSGNYRLEADYLYMRGQVAYEVWESSTKRANGRMDQYAYNGKGGPVSQCQATRFISPPFHIGGAGGAPSASIYIIARRASTTSGPGAFAIKNLCLVPESQWT